MEKARRYNKGKLRYGLIPPKSLSYVAEVYTRGAHKYSLYKDSEGNTLTGEDVDLKMSSTLELVEDGANNWKKGLPEEEVIDSLLRHIEAYRMRELLDPDLKTRHLANAVFNIFTLIEFEDEYFQ